MKQLLTLIFIFSTLTAFSQKDTAVMDSAYVKLVIEDIRKADDGVYGKVTKEQYLLIQQYNQLLLNIVSQRKKKIKKP